MDGLKILNSLTDDQKSAITQKFGSIGQLYKKVFDLTNQEYVLRNSNRQVEIQDQLFDIEDKLDEIGLDGHYIKSQISSDFGEIIVNKAIKSLDAELKKFGTDYETMRDWMKDKYGI
ncbi:hypothetical protein SAMN05216464_102336 [Mucilaginibacter pineti]|uniref:Uncharacterized protein n=1 Tax=Mucilaginibacter pineti TaxID=1391627 RepID=A0A1G6X0H4_9SPHI|nr:hypothetical protein [Mucilaginibacter pineti]SDD70745.1 hypothetical protein SAMN05216464_102336 [Mucilaginibacter pineti]